MMVDAHVHFWDPGVLDYPWLSGVPALQRPFLPADYAAASEDAGIAQVVFVEANAAPHQNEREVEFVERLATSADACVAAIVAYVDLTDSAERERTLDAMGAHARVKGIRQNIQRQPRGFALQDVFVDGVRSVGRRGLAFDLCVTHDQLPEMAALVAQCPDTRFVLDHCGKPRIRSADDDAWHRDLARLSRFDNVWCKMSGLLTETSEAATCDDVVRYASYALETFGPKRAVYGSDWPVLTLAGAYGAWLDVARRSAATLSADEARRFYMDNAIELYRI